MIAYCIHRLAQAVLVLLGASVVIFILMRLIPGDPTLSRLSVDATAEQVAAVRKSLGLDRPLVVQYFSWLGDVLHGDFGRSLVSGLPVDQVIAPRVAATIELTAAAVVVVIVLTLLAGLSSGLRPGTRTDAVVRNVNSALLAVPTFWMGILMVYVFALKLNVLPAGGRPSHGASLTDHLKALTLPALALGLSEMPITSRFLRAGLVDTLAKDFVRTARAKGLTSRRIVQSHILKNSLVPVVTVFGLSLGGMLGGVVVTETVFNWPGLGSLMIQAVEERDYSVVQAVLTIAVASFVFVNLIVDILYGWLDPRTRVGRRS